MTNNSIKITLKTHYCKISYYRKYECSNKVIKKKLHQSVSDLEVLHH